MHHDFIDRYSRIDSPIHRIPTATKIVCAVVMLVTVILIPPSRVWWFAGISMMLLAIAILGHIPLTFLAGRLLVLEPFVLGVALLSLLQANGVVVFLSLALRGTLCLITSILLSNTTPFSETLRVLRRMRAPGLLMTTLALMYRYVFVLVDEAGRMKRAQASRTFQPARFHLWRTGANVIGRLFVRSTERAERIYAAMCARGWKT